MKKLTLLACIPKRGKYGGTYAHKDIAFEFTSAISPVFKLYLIKEFERLKELENQNREWDIKRILSKNNYLIHTDDIKNYILPDSNYYKDKEWLKFEGVINKTKVSCENSGMSVFDCFVDADKSIISGKGRKSIIKDYKLTRCACYLIAQNGDSRKE